MYTNTTEHDYQICDKVGFVIFFADLCINRLQMCAQVAKKEGYSSNHDGRGEIVPPRQWQDSNWSLLAWEADMMHLRYLLGQADSVIR